MEVPGGMRLMKSNGMELKMSHGMQIKTPNGMKLKAPKGMGLRADNNYIKFNEYERARKYLQMGSHITRPRAQKPRAQTESAVVILGTPKRKFHPRKKWRKVLILLFAVSAFQRALARGTYRLQILGGILVYDKADVLEAVVDRVYSVDAQVE